MAKRKRKRKGAPTLLTPEIQKKICSALNNGNFIETACEYAGIGKTTFYLWLEKGEQGRPEYVDFMNSVRASIAQGEMRLVMAIHKKIDVDWKAAQYMLTCKFPERWGKKEQLKVFEAEQGEAFKPDGAYEKMLEAIQKIEGEEDE